ncbi:MAG: FAD-dependent monooxygenase [Balneolaceae bacterium]
MQKEKVLITGAGPTGLSCANLLAKMDIPFLLIDKNPQPSKESKAFAIHARTLEIFDQLGIADRAVSEGNTDNTLHLINKDKEVGKFRFTEILPGETNYPHVLVLPQDNTEKLMTEALEEKGQKVHWTHKLTNLSQNKDRVTATIKLPSGEETEKEFQYVIGCDGAGSKVRDKAGFSFKGKTFSSTFYLADSEIKWKFSHGDIYFIFSRGYLSGLFSFPEKNKYRLFNFLNSSVQR